MRIPSTKSKKRAVAMIAEGAQEVICIKTKRNGSRASLTCHTVAQVNNFYGDCTPRVPSAYDLEQKRRMKNVAHIDN